MWISKYIDIYLAKLWNKVWCLFLTYMTDGRNSGDRETKWKQQRRILWRPVIKVTVEWLLTVKFCFFNRSILIKCLTIFCFHSILRRVYYKYVYVVRICTYLCVCFCVVSFLLVFPRAHLPPTAVNMAKKCILTKISSISFRCYSFWFYLFLCFVIFVNISNNNNNNNIESDIYNLCCDFERRRRNKNSRVSCGEVTTTTIIITTICTTRTTTEHQQWLCNNVKWEYKILYSSIKSQWRSSWTTWRNGK